MACVFLRGNPGKSRAGRAAAVSHVPSPARIDRKLNEGSGRLQLAQAIASKDNPLTARVMVNRVWAGHFGAGARPDAERFRHALRAADSSGIARLAGGAVHGRRLVAEEAAQADHAVGDVSAVERSTTPPTRATDPENRFVWRINPQRLDFEAMRDSLLAVSGKLDAALGGRAVDITDRTVRAARTVYGFIDRQNLPGIFRTFDFASPDATSPQRFVTTVPQQALFMMNSPFVCERRPSG